LNTTLKMADDFVIGGAGWIIQFVQFYGSFFPTYSAVKDNVVSWTVEIYLNDDEIGGQDKGMPYASPIYTWNGVPATDLSSPNPIFNLTSNPAYLSPGTYWISVYATVNFPIMTK
jgi:hypothetical protein